MKDYTFRIKVDMDRDNKYLKKKQFKIKLKNDIDDYNMFEEAIAYLNDKVYEYFGLGDELYIDFKIVRGNKTATCWLESDHCPNCGGYVEVGGVYYEK